MKRCMVNMRPVASTCTLKILLELESRLSPPHSSLLFLIIPPFLGLFCISKEMKTRMQNSQIVSWTAPRFCWFTSTFPPSGHRTLVLYCTGLFCEKLERGKITSLCPQQAGSSFLGTIWEKKIDLPSEILSSPKCAGRTPTLDGVSGILWQVYMT